MAAVYPSVPSPGEVLLESYLYPLGITQSRFARAIGRPQSGVSDLVRGRRALTAEMAWLLGQALGTDPAYWLGLEAAYRLSLLDTAKLPQVELLVGLGTAGLGEPSDQDDLEGEPPDEDAPDQDGLCEEQPSGGGAD